LGKKKKSKEPEIVPYKIESYDEADKKLLELGIFGGAIMKMEAEMNREIQAVKERYDKNESLKYAKDESARIFAGIKKFCDEHKSDFEKRRTRELTNGRIGFQTNPNKVVPLNSKLKVEDILEKMKNGFRKYIRKTETINRDLILNDYANAKTKLTDEKLAKAGLKIDKDETFVCESNWQELNADSAA
jgi:phage host-nuclease inhibitor protein Gam